MTARTTGAHSGGSEAGKKAVQQRVPRRRPAKQQQQQQHSLEGQHWSFSSAEYARVYEQALLQRLLNGARRPARRREHALSAATRAGWHPRTRASPSRGRPG